MFKTKSKESIQEAADIVRNSQDDDAAIQFLKEALEDDFPDLELGSMDLHEAIKVLGGSESFNTAEKDTGGGNKQAIEDLNKTLGAFMSKQNKAKAPVKQKVKAKRKVKRKRRKKKT